MLDVTHGERKKVEDPKKDLLSLIDTSFDKEVELQLQAPRSYQDKFTAKLETGVEKLSRATEGILVRETRQNLDRLVTWLKAITRSCLQDPSDIDLELALPMIINQIADAAEDYASAVSLPRLREQHRQTLTSFEREIREVRLPWARALLDKMSLNDSLPAAERLALSTSFFKEK